MSATPFIEHLIDAVVDCLQAVDGTGDWNNDLSGTGTVAIAEKLTTAITVAVAAPDLDRDRTVVTLGEQDRAARFLLMGQVGGTGYEARLKAAFRLEHDVVRAVNMQTLTAALNAISSGLGNQLKKVDFDAASMDGHNDPNLLGNFLIRLTCVYRVGNYNGI